MLLLVIKIPEAKENWTFIIEENNENTIDRIIELLRYEYYFYYVGYVKCKIIDQSKDWYGNDSFKGDDFESLLWIKYDYHIENLNDFLKKYDEYLSNNNIDDIKEYAKNIHNIEDSIKYHRKVVKMIRSLARLNQISLAQEETEQDTIHYRLPGSVFK